MRLSILEQTHISKGQNAEDALRNTVGLAELTDDLGFHRIWLAEHHGIKNIASSAPEITAAYIASKTQRIRVGTGGIMMMHYSPLKIAEIIKTLCALSPKRIDFGIGSSPGADNHTVYALAQGRSSIKNNIYDKFKITLDYLQDITPNDDLYNNSIAVPTNVSLPVPWLLGTSAKSALQAAKMGVGFAFAHFLNSKVKKEIFDMYIDNFTPSQFLKTPQVIVAYLITTAETREEAEYEALPQDISGLYTSKGKTIEIMTPEEVSKYPLTEMDRIKIKDNRRVHLVGSIEEISERLKSDQQLYQYDEAMVLTITHSHQKRLNVYRLLAKYLIK